VETWTVEWGCGLTRFNLPSLCGVQGDCSESAEALLFLAHYRKKGGDYEAAAQYCNTLLELPHPGRVGTGHS
jgi:hypothetical protein